MALRVVLYDYETERVRGKVRKNLKKLGLHAQWSVFESEEKYQKIVNALLEEGENYRVAVFRVRQDGDILRLGKLWETFKFVF